MRVAQGINVTSMLLTDEARFARTTGRPAKYLRINSKWWDHFLEETPYAAYCNRSRMTYYNSQIVLDPSIDKWEFTNEDARRT